MIAAVYNTLLEMILYIHYFIQYILNTFQPELFFANGLDTAPLLSKHTSTLQVLFLF